MQLLISLFLLGMVSAARQSIYYPLPSLFIPTGHPRITRSPGDNVINTLSETNEPNTGDGSYSYSYQTENGITAQEQGYLKEDVPEGPGAAAQGSYSYTLDDGQTITVTYTADENGFVVQGDHIPKPPPIPEAILRALELNAAEEAANGEGSDFEPTNILKRHTENYTSQQRKR